jgi:exonuclease 1
MGISGLLTLLKPIQVQKHLSEYAGQTLAVDGHVWLHRGVHSCATELATGKATIRFVSSLSSQISAEILFVGRYVHYMMQRVRLLRYHHIEPYLVFDGGPLPAKLGTEVKRQRKRTECLERGKALMAQGKKGQAREWFSKSVDVTAEMVFQ